MRRKSINLFSILLTVCLTLLLTSTEAFAGKHWLSGSKLLDEFTEGKIATSATSRMVGSTRVFNIVISLESNPSTQAERDPYEEIIGHFADAVYEATEGDHKIGKVHIYKKGDYAPKSDIFWTEKEGWPSANSCRNGIDGNHIYMYDTFTKYDACGPVKTYNFISNASDRKIAGHILGHEWGHFTYCLYDEYRNDYCDCKTGLDWDWCFVSSGAALKNIINSAPWTDDIPVIPSIMNYRNAPNIDDSRWLNFSIAYQEGDGLFRDTGRTAQHRMYGASAWETLTRDVEDDPKPSALLTRAERTYFSELSNVDPQDEPTIQLPDSAARSELEIIWMTDKLVYEIVLDKSASMGDVQFDNGQRIINAKKAAKFFVDQAEIGKTAIGVIAFNNSSQEVYPITDISNEGARQNIKDAIDGITTYDGTAIYDAAKIALDKLLLRGETESRVVFLLTDGASNSDYIFTTPEQVIAYYKNYNIPLFTFGYGTAAYGEFNPAVLSKMATETGGKYYYSPVELNDIIPIFNDAKKEVSPSTVGIASSSSTLLPSSTQAYDFPIDSTVNQLNVSIVHNGALSDFAANLKDPAGNIYYVTDCSQSGAETICLYSHDAPQTGMWQITYASQAASSLNITSSIDGIKKDVITYSLSATNLTGDTIQYPNPILLLVSFNKELPIAEAVVSGTIEFPNGSSQQLTFRDDGVAPDYIAKDGKYSAIFTDYSMNGVYKIRVSANNSNNTAYMTYNGLQSYNTLPMPPDIPLGEAVERAYTFQITVKGVVSDDHGNDFSTATVITADNSDHPGKIEVNGDIDFFKINIPDPSVSEVVFRVTHLSPNMIPVLTVYDNNGMQLGQKVYVPGESYPSISINPNGRSVFYASVKYSGDNGTGTYYISAGTGIASDAIISTINLVTGWNLISLPVLPDNIAISDVLGSLSGKYTVVWAYQNGAWKVYNPANPGFSDLTTLEPGYGYWIKMKQASTLNITGSTVSKSKSLSVGWNLVGYNSTTAQPIASAFSSIAGKYVSVWTYVNGSWKVYDPANPGFSDLTTMEPGRGYWIKAKQACTWTLP